MPLLRLNPWPLGVHLASLQAAEMAGMSGVATQGAFAQLGKPKVLTPWTHDQSHGSNAIHTLQGAGCIPVRFP